MKDPRRNTAREQSAKYQYIAAFVVNLLTIGYGITGGWSSPSTILLMSDETPLASGPITLSEASWIVSFVYIGGVIGNIFFGFVTNHYGRKRPLIVVTIPIIISWTLILFAPNKYYLYASRILNGFIGGGIFVIVPLFLTEIAFDRVRGALGSTLILSENIGMLLAYTLGHYCDYYIIPKVSIALTVLCAVLLYFLPESPSFLMKQNKIYEAEKSVRFYQNLYKGNGEYDMLQLEMRKLLSTLDDEKTESSIKWSDLKKPPTPKALIIGLALASLNQLCGCFAMLNYTANVFEEAGSNLSSNMCAIIIGVITILGSYISTTLVDRAGRKILFAVSTIGTSVGLIILGTYVLMKSRNFEVDAYNWIPLVSFSFVIFIASLGVLNLPFVVITEVMPDKFKDYGVSLCMTFIWFLAFVMVKCLPYLYELIGFHGSMFLFSGVCLLGELFIVCYVPETKGKSHDQIMASLR